MRPTELFNIYFSKRKMKNVFLYFNAIINPEINKWEAKSKHEINRIVNLILNLQGNKGVLPEKEICMAIHESIASCFTSVVFNLFNIFNIVYKLTGNESSFFDDHIFEYFHQKYNITKEKKENLKFSWLKPISVVDGYGYDRDLKLHVFDVDGKSGFQVFEYDSLEPQISNPFDKIEPIIPSADFFLLHLLNLLWSIELIAKYCFLEIYPEKDFDELFTVNKRESHIPVERIKQLLVAYFESFGF